MGVLLNRRRYMSASKQAKTLFEMYDQYFDGTVNSVVDTGLKLWDGTHNRWKMEVVFQRITVINSNTTLFAVRPDVSPYSGIRVRQRSSYSFDLTISDTWETIENPGNFYIYVISSYGNAIDNSSSLEYDSLTLIRNGQYLYCDYNDQTATLKITDPRTNNLNLLIGCDYQGANNGTQRYYTGTIQKFVIKELSSADEVIMTSITNPEVLAVCYAQGWCADANYMTKEEAEAVTTIGTAFRNNSSITHFEEFRYFTSVTKLEQYAFNKCSNLEVITLPTTITHIKYNTFGECSNLTTVNLSNVSVLGGAVFYICKKLDNIQLSALTSIGSQCFDSCSSLTNVVLPSAITSLPTRCFLGCTNLNLTTTTPVTSIGERALNKTGITQLDLSSVVTIGNASCESSKITSVDIGEYCTSIADAAFYNCRQLQYVIIRATTPPTLANGNHAFTNGSSKYPIYVPDSAYETYLAATNWSYYSTRIKKISEKP